MGAIGKEQIIFFFTKAFYIALQCIPEMGGLANWEDM